MDTSSEYSFPIFISSTDYNLKDFRAELARFLTELGYRPILSSAEGFPDNSPKLEPWESCLPVLDKTFVVILVIDGKYGTRLPWPNFKEFFGDVKAAPTHGEYLFTHKRNKRMLVFIRREVMTYYQSYRQALKNYNGNEEETRSVLAKTLPDYVELDTLKFIDQVKTTKPIPWIKEFNDITDVKKEVQKKMLNELAEIFLVKDMHLQTVIEVFNKLLDTLQPEEQKKVLGKVNVTKEFMDVVEKVQQLTKDLEETKGRLSETAEGKTQVEDRIKELHKEISKLEASSHSNFDTLYLKDGKIKLSNPSFLGAVSFLSTPYVDLAKATANLGTKWIPDYPLSTSYVDLATTTANFGTGSQSFVSLPSLAEMEKEVNLGTTTQLESAEPLLQTSISKT